MEKLTIKDIDIKDKRVLIRADFNVPLDGSKITDDARITKSLETIRYAMDQNAKVILMSHLGRPKGKRAPEFSLKPVAERLSELLSKKVELLSDCVGDEIESKVTALSSGDVVLLENLRFHEAETKNCPDFSKQLASLGEVYINDAFGTAHRAHASTEGVTKYLPSAAGFLLGKEINYFQKAISNPDRPFVAILGGAKVVDKVKLISSLLEKTDKIIIGGAMAYTFYKVQGIEIGDSKFDPAGLDAAKDALEKSKEKNVPIILPEDRVIAQKMEKGAETKVVEGDIPAGWSGFDIGPKSRENFRKILSDAKTIVWNGPLGLFEIQPFDEGTRNIAEYITELDATTIIGGGDTAAAITQFGFADKVSHVSTGGGASLEFLEGTVLPGVAALQDKSEAAKS